MFKNCLTIGGKVAREPVFLAYCSADEMGRGTIE